MAEHPPSSHEPSPTTGGSRRRFRPAVVVPVLAALAGVVVVAALLLRPEASYTDDIDEQCADVNERFGDDLALGDGFGSGDLDTLEQRIDVVAELRRHVEETDVPADTTPPDEWLEKLDAFVDQMSSFKDFYEQAQMGEDMLVVMMSAEVDDAAVEVGEAAARDGLESCSDVESWQLVPGGQG
jgi:hypothetical protein